MLLKQIILIAIYRDKFWKITSKFKNNLSLKRLSAKMLSSIKRLELRLLIKYGCGRLGSYSFFACNFICQNKCAHNIKARLIV